MSLEETVFKTVEDVLPKRGKLSTTLDAVMVDQLDHLGQNEIDNAQRFMEMAVFKDDKKSPAEATEEMNRNLVVADNITYNTPQPPQPPQKKSMAPALILAAALASGVGGWAVAQMQKPQVDTNTDTDTKYDLGFTGDYEEL